jgi:hypothetical protein
MKGKNIFTTTQISEIKKLIAKKVLATEDKQKGIRAKIRKLEFYYSDFSAKKNGYTVADFETLISSGQIKVTGGNNKLVEQAISKSTVTIKPATTTILPTSETTDLTSLLQTFKQNRFDPTTDSETTIPDKSGNYILCLKPNSNLPKVSITPTLTSFNRMKVIYTGIAGGSLRNRDYRQHFKGNNAGRSTLRKSLGALFGYKQIPRDSDPSNDEQKLTEWMINNLVMYFLPTTSFGSIEIKLINHFNPPLNLKDNHNSINADFRKLLSYLRSQK